MTTKASLVLVFLTSLASEANADASGWIIGQWARGDGQARVKIEKCGNAICVINTWIKPGESNEKVGDRLIITVASAQNGGLSGSAYDPQRKLIMKIALKGDAATMTSSGCLLAGLICKSASWRRIQ